MMFLSKTMLHEVQSSSLLTEFSPLERGQVSMETNNGSSGMPVSPVLFPEASAYPSVRQKGNPLNRKEWILSGRLSDNMSSMVNLPEHHPEEAIVQTEPQPSNWNVEEVYEFIKALPRCAPYAEEFRSKEIDGIALMLLKEYHLLGIMNIKLGPALKICEKISSLKEAHDSKVGR